jgi:histidyl-tRNA synthetase
MDKIQRVFERFGYDTIETPVLNYAEVILGKYGEEGDRLTYAFEDRGGRRIALPYDLTVPFARLFSANYSKLPIPFKRYQIQRVWRAERPQKGRLREFYQCDIDAIGSTSVVVEAEMCAAASDVLTTLGFTDFTIRLNHRGLLSALLRRAGIPQDKHEPVLVELDKLAGEPMDLYVNGKLLAQGEVVVVENNFGVRITSIVDAEARLKGLKA